MNDTTTQHNRRADDMPALTFGTIAHAHYEAERAYWASDPTHDPVSDARLDGIAEGIALAMSIVSHIPVATLRERAANRVLEERTRALANIERIREMTNL